MTADVPGSCGGSEVTAGLFQLMFLLVAPFWTLMILAPSWRVALVTGLDDQRPRRR